MHWNRKGSNPITTLLCPYSFHVVLKEAMMYFAVEKLGFIPTPDVYTGCGFHLFSCSVSTRVIFLVIKQSERETHCLLSFNA